MDSNQKEAIPDILELELEADHPVIAIIGSLEKMTSDKLKERIAWLIWTVERMEDRIAELEGRLDNIDQRVNL